MNQSDHRNQIYKIYWWVLAAVFLVSPKLHGAEQNQPERKTPRFLHIPVEQLEHLSLENKAVFLSQEEFDKLWEQSETNKISPSDQLRCEKVKYQAELSKEQLRLLATFELTKVKPGLQKLRIPARIFGVESARIGEQTALLQRQGANLILFTEQTGRFDLEVQFVVPVRKAGSDQLVSVALPKFPSGSMQWSLNTGQKLLVNGQELQPDQTQNDKNHFSFPVGNQTDWNFRVTVENGTEQRDRLLYATSSYGVYADGSEISWSTETQIEVFGQPLNQLRFTVPNRLEVMSVDSTGLESWELEESSLNSKRTAILLNYRQGVTGRRSIQIRGVTLAEASGQWMLPNLVLEGTDSHTGQAVIGFKTPWKVRVEQMEGVRRNVGKPLQFSGIPEKSRTLQFDLWRPDFQLALVNESLKSGLQAAVANIINIQGQEVTLQSNLTVEATGTDLFDTEIELPASWELEGINANGKKTDWQNLRSEPGRQRIRIPLVDPLKPGAEVNILLTARLVEEIVEEEQTVALPLISLPQAELVEGTFLIKADDKYLVEHLSSTDLEPVQLNLPGERLSYRFHEGEYAGELLIKAKPSSLVTQTTTLVRMEREQMVAQHEVLLDVSNAPIYDLLLTLEHVVDPKKVNFRFANDTVRITAELLGEEEEEATEATSAHVWHLSFSRPLQGEARLLFNTITPRTNGSEESLQVPEILFETADRQYGSLLVEAEGDQRIEVEAVDQQSEPLPTLNLSEFPATTLRPQSRIVSAFRFVREGYNLKISEQRFERSDLSIAFCDKAKLNSILTETGEIHHQVMYAFRTVNSQSLIFQLPEGAQLWSVLLNTEPEPVRKTEEGYQVNLSQKVGADRTQYLTVVYARETAEFESSARVQEQTPPLYAVDGAGAKHSVPLLEQNWELRYPAETTILKSTGEFQSVVGETSALDRILEQILSLLQTKVWTRGIWILAGFVLLVLVLNFKKSLKASFFVFLAVCGVVGVVGILMLSTMRFSHDNPNYQAPGTGAYSAQNRVYTYGESFGIEEEASEDRATFDMPQNKELLLKNMIGLAQNPTEGKAQIACRRLGEMGNSASSALPTLKEVAQKSEHASVREEATKAIARIEKAIANQSSLGRFGVPQEDPGAIMMKNSAQDVSQEEGVGGFGGGVLGGGAGGIAEEDTEFRLLNTTIRGKNRLSVKMRLQALQQMQTAEFAYRGNQPGGLDLVIRNQEHDRTVALVVFAAMLLLGWAIQHQSLQLFGRLMTLGIMGPFVLMFLVPVVWTPWLVGIFAGSLGAILMRGGVFLARLCSIKCFKWCSCFCSGAAMILLALTLSSSPLQAQEQSESAGPFGAFEAPATEAKPEVTNWLQDPNTFVIPAGTGKVILSPEQHRRLWQQAYEQTSGQSGSHRNALVASAEYTLNIPTSNKQAHLTGKGRYVIYVFEDKPQRVRIPIQDISILSATLEGKPANLESRSEPVQQPEQQRAQKQQTAIQQQVDTQTATPLAVYYELHVEKAGLQILDLEFQLPAELQSGAGQFSLKLLPVSTGLLNLEFDETTEENLFVQISGVGTPYRKVSNGTGTRVEQTVSPGGNFEIKWQPQNGQDETDAIVHGTTLTDLQVKETGIEINTRSKLSIRRGEWSQLLFKIPEETKVQEVSGEDVGGWSFEERDGQTFLSLILRRAVADETEISVKMFQPKQLAGKEQAVTFPRFGVENLNREAGWIRVFGSKYLSLKTNRVSGIRQINVTELPAGFKKTAASQLAFKHTHQPFELSLSLWQNQSLVAVDANHAVSVERQAIISSSHFRYQLQGQPLLHLELELAEDFLPLDISSPGMLDWYLERNEGQPSRLVLEYQRPQQGLVELIISGKTLREVSDQNVVLSVPKPIAVDRARQKLAVWFSDYYTPNVSDRGNWTVFPVNQLGKELLSRKKIAPRFAFSTKKLDPTEIQFKVLRTQPGITADAVTLINVSETSLSYTLAMKWKIIGGGADQFSFRVPQWLKGKLQLTGNGIRQAVETTTESGAAQWVVETQKLQQNEYFLTAIAVSELPQEGQFSHPPIEFLKQVVSEIPGETTLQPLESSQNYSIVVNHSSAHLIQRSGVAEVVDRTTLPIKIEEEYLDQAVTIQKLPAGNEEPKWDINWAEENRTVASQILLAEITNMVEQDGSLRGTVMYRIKNTDKQHVALRIPDNLKLLSVIVDEKPTRAVKSVLGKEPVYLIPLPKQEIQSLTFPVTLTYQSIEPLSTAFESSVQLTSHELELPSPKVVSLEESEEWGLPVSHTQWTVHLPEGYEISYLEGAGNTNMSQTVYEGMAADIALFEEAKSLLDMFEFDFSSKPDKMKSKMYLDLKQRLSSVEQGARGRTQNSQGLSLESAEIISDNSGQARELLSRLEDNEAKASKEQAQQQEKGINLDQTQRRYLLRQNEGLLLNNGVSGVIAEDENSDHGNEIHDFYFQPAFKEKEVLLEQDHFDNWALQAPAQDKSRGKKLSQSLSKTKELLKDSINNQAIDSPTQRFDKDGDGVSSSNVEPNVPTLNAIPIKPRNYIYNDSSFGLSIANTDTVLPPLDGWPNSGTIVGLSQPGQFAKDLGGNQIGAMVQPTTKTLSLPVELVMHGQTVSFSKVGGNPRLILTTRSNRTWTHLLSCVGIALGVLLAGISWKCFFSSQSNQKSIQFGIVLCLYLSGSVLFFCFNGPLFFVGLLLLILGACCQILFRRKLMNPTTA